METLTELFKEKQAKNPKPQAVAKAPKKIKKKDIPIVPIYERELQFYEFSEVSNIKIYNGVLEDAKEDMNNSIEFYQLISPGTRFTELRPGTLTACGELTNIIFKEEDYIKTLEIPPIDYSPIVKIVCNFGEIYMFPNPFINHPLVTMIRSIKALHNLGTIKIGCRCNSPIDTELVFNMVTDIEKYANLFTNIYLKYIRDKLPNDKVAAKKRTKRILKNFGNIQNYWILPIDELREIFDTIKQYVVDESDMEFCIEYITKITKVISIFTNYEKECKCVKQYIKEHNISIDREELAKQVKSSARGRKPKEKKNPKRKVQGTGNHFSSQISFEIYNFVNNKITKIKLFRNGNFQVPGVKNPQMLDLLDSAIMLKNYLNYMNSIKTIAAASSTSPEAQQLIPSTNITSNNVIISHLISVMRNYVCKLSDDNVTIILNKLEEVLNFEKSMSHTMVPITSYIRFIKDSRLSAAAIYNVFKYINVGFYSISEISLNNERYSGLLVKFLRPIPNNDSKKITIKILGSGKINIDGGNSELEVYEIYHWLEYIFNKYWDEVTFNSFTKIDEEVSSDSCSDYQSVYDDEIKSEPEQEE